jgi:hypothetical protein
MATPRRRFAYLSGTSAQQSSRVEMRSSDNTPVAQESAEWCMKYQMQLEATAEQVQLIKEAGESEQSAHELGEVEI